MISEGWKTGRFLAVGSTAMLLGLGSQWVWSSLYEVESADVEDVSAQGKVAKSDVERNYSPYVGRDYPDQVLFGDTHFHTNLSFDAGLVGTSLDVDAGYRFARGEKVISNSGQPAQLIRPLDFLVITDHAEFIGLAPMIQQSDPALLADPWGKWVYERFNAGPEGRMEAVSYTHLTLPTSKPKCRSRWSPYH